MRALACLAEFQKRIERRLCLTNFLSARTAKTRRGDLQSSARSGSLWTVVVITAPKASVQLQPQAGSSKQDYLVNEDRLAKFFYELDDHSGILLFIDEPGFSAFL